MSPLQETSQANEELRSAPLHTGAQEVGMSWIWVSGGSLAIILILLVGLFGLVTYNGLKTFWPFPIETIEIDSHKIHTIAIRNENYTTKDKIVERTLHYQGNLELTQNEFLYQDSHLKSFREEDVWLLERQEWGKFLGYFKTLQRGEEIIENPSSSLIQEEIQKGEKRRDLIQKYIHDEISQLNHSQEKARLNLRSYKTLLETSEDVQNLQNKIQQEEKNLKDLERTYEQKAAELQNIYQEDHSFKVILQDGQGREKEIYISHIIRALQPNSLNVIQKLHVYFSRIFEFLTAEPREANMEGGVFPAIFGTICMTLLMVVVVMPFGVLAAIFMREIAKQGILVSLIRIAVGNLAGVPSIVYGVFGLGFFCYTLGTSLDALLFSSKLPTPTFGTGGILWASLTLALLTVPVVIVSTEEALSAVPASMRQASYGCGATRFQTIWNIVLPKAMPGILTGMILAMARGMGEVAPLLLTGVVKLAPDLPFDTNFPFFHLERSFMHLGFHIYDLGFQSRSVELSKPMVFSSTLLLIFLVLLLNVLAIRIRSVLRKRFEGRGAF